MCRLCMIVTVRSILVCRLGGASVLLSYRLWVRVAARVWKQVVMVRCVCLAVLSRLLRRRRGFGSVGLRWTVVCSVLLVLLS